MILADTSIWIDHLRGDDARLAELLASGLILMHPFISGEIALGNLRHRNRILDLLDDLPKCLVAVDSEVLRFIDRHALFGRGIGYIDAHLLVSVALTPGAKLFTRDRRLDACAVELALAAQF